MSRAAWFALAFGVTAVAADAAAYDDYSSGLAAVRAGKTDLAIEAFTAAIAAGDLAPTYRPSAYMSRAAAYAAKGDCAKAEADLDQSLRLRPAYLEATLRRAHVRDCLNKYEDARSDFDAVIKLSATTEPYRARGQFFWQHSKFDSAAADYQMATDLAPANSYVGARRGYPLLWYAISAVRAGNFDAVGFDQRLKKIDIDGWPLPLLEFIQGKASLDAAYAKAARGEGEVPAQQKCEADFYIGEWQIGHGDSSGKVRIRSAEQNCPHNFIEYWAAQQELKRLP